MTVSPPAPDNPRVQTIRPLTLGEILRVLRQMGIERKGYDIVSPYERKKPEGGA